VATVMGGRVLPSRGEWRTANRRLCTVAHHDCARRADGGRVEGVAAVRWRAHFSHHFSRLEREDSVLHALTFSESMQKPHSRAGACVRVCDAIGVAPGAASSAARATERISAGFACRRDKRRGSGVMYLW